MLREKLLYIFFMLTVNLYLPAQSEVKIYNDFDSFEHLLHKDNDSIYVINFWATWCKPCVEELPYFEKLGDTRDLNVILVSLDLIKQLDTKLIPFIEEKEILSRVVLLNDTKYNKWIDKVSPEWSGAIPATIIYKGGERLFLETEFESYEDLKSEIDKFFEIN